MMGRRCRLWDQVYALSPRPCILPFNRRYDIDSQEKLLPKIRDVILKEEVSELTIQNVRSRQIPENNVTFVIRAIYTIVESATSISHRNEPRSKWTCRQRVNFNRFHSNVELVTFFRIRSILTAPVMEPLLKENMTLEDYCVQKGKPEVKLEIKREIATAGL